MKNEFDDFIKENLIEPKPTNQESFRTTQIEAHRKEKIQKALKTTAFSLVLGALAFSGLHLFQQPDNAFLTASDHDFLEELFAYEDQNLSDDEDILLWEVAL